MQIEIKYDEHIQVLEQVASKAIELLKTLNDLQYIIIHLGDGTCLKAGVNTDTDTLWVVRYTEDDDAVE